MSEVQKHRHILRRATRAMYSCIDDCAFREAKSFLLGRIVRCPFCQREFKLTLEDLRRTLPRCPSCSDTKKSRVQNELDKLFTDSLPSSEKEDENSDLKEKVGF